MSSCFTVDVSVDFPTVGLILPCHVTPNSLVYMARSHAAVIVGSGAYQNSTMHSGVGNVNYVSYRVRRIKLEVDYVYTVHAPVQKSCPDYAVLFKVPYREPIVKENFSLLRDFILYREPEKVLGYDLSAQFYTYDHGSVDGHFNIDVTKPNSC